MAPARGGMPTPAPAPENPTCAWCALSAAQGPRFAVTTGVLTPSRRLPAAIELDLVERYGASLNPHDTQFTPADLSTAMREADILLCTLTDNLSRKTIEGARNGRIKLLANFGVGFNHIDLRAELIVIASNRGIELQ